MLNDFFKNAQISAEQSRFPHLYYIYLPSICPVAGTQFFLVFTVNLTPVGIKARNFTFNKKPAGFCIAYYVIRYFKLFANLFAPQGLHPFAFKLAYGNLF